METGITDLLITQLISLGRTAWKQINAKAQENQSFPFSQQNQIDELLNEILINSKLGKIQTLTLTSEFMEQLLVKHFFSAREARSIKTVLLGLEGRLHHLGDTFSSHYEPIYAGPGIPAGFKTVPAELPYPSVSSYDVVPYISTNPEIEPLKYLMPTSWEFANSDNERQEHWKQGFTPDERKDLLAEKERFYMQWYIYPTSYSGPVLTNAEKIQTFLDMLMSSISYDSGLNVSMYADLRLLIEDNSHRFRTQQKLLNAVLDLKAIKNAEEVRAKRGAIEKLREEGYDTNSQFHEIESRLFDVSNVSDLVEQGTLRPDDLSEHILTNMDAEAKKHSFVSTYNQLRQDISSQANSKEVIGLHCLIYKAIRLYHMLDRAIPEGADANIDRLSQDLGITANQHQEMASQIGLLYDLSYEGWFEAYGEIVTAVNHAIDNATWKDKWKARSLNATSGDKIFGFQTPFSFVKASLLGRVAHHHANPA